MKTCPGFCCFGSHGLEKGSDTSELGGKNIMAKFPYADVDWHLRALAGGAEGFGHFAIGGLHGPIYCVTTLADDGPGSLREGCRRKEPLWIVFEISGTINLSSYLSVSSYKTIDGRGQRVKLTGKGLRLKECEHIIVCNLEFEGGRGHDVDGIQIKPNSRHIWIDRCSLRDYDDGLIDITRQSTDITVSRCYFAQHDKTMLIGADPSHVGDRCIRVTIHHCFFDGTRQRQPRLRFGRVHLYNNYTRNWGIYAVCASVEAQIYSQCNIYEAGQKKKTFEYYTEKAFYDITDRTEVIHDPFQLEYVKSCNSLDFVVVNTVNEAGSVESASTLGFEATDRDEAKSGLIRSEGDMFLNGAQACLLTGVGEELVFHPSEHYPTWTYEAPSDSLKETLQICTGWQSIPRPAQMNL